MRPAAFLHPTLLEDEVTGRALDRYLAALDEVEAAWQALPPAVQLELELDAGPGEDRDTFTSFNTPLVACTPAEA